MKFPDNAVIANGTSITLCSRLVAVTTTSSRVCARAWVANMAADTARGSASFENAWDWRFDMSGSPDAIDGDRSNERTGEN